MLAYVLATRGERVERWRVAVFAAGCLLLLATAVTPLEALSYHLLSSFWASRLLSASGLGGSVPSGC